MMTEKKELSSVEYSLKSISWHLKTLVEELKKFREQFQGKSPETDDLPF